MTIASPTKIMNPTLQRVLRDQEEILLNQKVLVLERGVRVSLDLIRRPAGVNATILTPKSVSDARAIVSGQEDYPDTIGANVIAMGVTIAALLRGKKSEPLSLRRDLREPSC